MFKRGPSSKHVKSKVLVQGLESTITADRIQQPIHTKTNSFKRFGSLSPSPISQSALQNSRNRQQPYMNQKQQNDEKQVILEQVKQNEHEVSQTSSLNQSHYIINTYNNHIHNNINSLRNNSGNSISNNINISNNQITVCNNSMKPIFVNNEYSNRSNQFTIQSPMDERISQHQIFQKPQNSVRQQSPSQRSQFIFNPNVNMQQQQQSQQQQKKGIFVNQLNTSVKNIEQMKQPKHQQQQSYQQTQQNTGRKSTMNLFEGVNNPNIQEYIDQQILQRSQYIYEQINQQINKVENGSQQYSSNQMQQFINTYEQDLDKIKQSFQQILDGQNQQKRMIEQNQKDIQILRNEQIKLNQKVEQYNDGSKMMSQSRVQDMSAQQQNEIIQLNKKLDYEIQMLKDSQKIQLENKKIQEQNIRDQQKQIQSVQQQLSGFVNQMSSKESQISGKQVSLEEQIRQMKQQQNDQLAKIQQNVHLQRQVNSQPSNNFQQVFNKSQIQPDRQSVYQQYQSTQK